MEKEPLDKIFALWKEEYKSRKESPKAPDWDRFSSDILKPSSDVFHVLGEWIFSHISYTVIFALLCVFGVHQLNGVFEMKLAEFSIASSQYLTWLEGIV
jgi:hypothetical protein